MDDDTRWPRVHHLQGRVAERKLLAARGSPQHNLVPTIIPSTSSPTKRTSACIRAHLERALIAEAFVARFPAFDRFENTPMSGSIKGALENVVKGKLVLKGGKGVGGGAASAAHPKSAGISKEASDAPKLVSSGPKVYDTRTPYEKVRSARARARSVHSRFTSNFTR